MKKFKKERKILNPPFDSNKKMFGYRTLHGVGGLRLMDLDFMEKISLVERKFNQPPSLYRLNSISFSIFVSTFIHMILILCAFSATSELFVIDQCARRPGLHYMIIRGVTILGNIEKSLSQQTFHTHSTIFVFPCSYLENSFTLYLQMHFRRLTSRTHLIFCF